MLPCSLFSDGHKHIFIFPIALLWFLLSVINIGALGCYYYFVDSQVIYFVWLDVKLIIGKVTEAP